MFKLRFINISKSVSSTTGSIKLHLVLFGVSEVVAFLHFFVIFYSRFLPDLLSGNLIKCLTCKTFVTSMFLDTHNSLLILAGCSRGH